MASDTITNNLNEIISTKNEFKQIIQENGLTAGTVFSEYPSQIRSLINGGGSGYLEYLNTYQFAYVSGISGTSPGCAVNLAGDGSLVFQGSYVKANVFSYPLTSDFTGYEFVSMGTLMNYVNSYASTYITIPDLSSYVTKTELSNASYVTSADLPTVNENIIPKSNNTYTLGDSTYLYAATYTSDLWLNSTNRISNRSNNQVNLQLNGSWRYTFHVNNFGPAADNTRDLGESSVRWRSTYTANIYADNAYISSATYLPINTYWYDGSTYHWLGSLFS